VTLRDGAQPILKKKHTTADDVTLAVLGKISNNQRSLADEGGG
jgi:hypothetical protein